MRTTPDGIPINPDVPRPLETPPGVPRDDTIWHRRDDVPNEADDDRLSYALCSGGDDSLVMTHRVMNSGDADAVLYLNTNTGLSENLRYVEDVCDRYNWPLRIERSPVSLVELAMKYSFPGSSYHTVAYSYLKERQLSRIAGEYEGQPEYITGVYKDESNRRMENLSDVGAVSVGKGGRWIWKQPLIDDTTDEINDYRERHDLPENEIKRQIHRSGDCYCGAFAHRDELLVDLRAHGYDRHATWLHAVEAAVHEYRGRLDYFEEIYPDEWNVVDDRRDNYNPKPMRLPILREMYPTVADDVDAIPKGDAIARGRKDTANYWGHGGMTNDELRVLIAEKDLSQATLCDACGVSDLQISDTN